jgi:PAS domain S-box-containing protein
MERTHDAYEVFFRRSAKPMYIFDVRTLAFVDVNDGALALYGYDRSAFLALTALDIRPPHEIAEFYTSLRADDPSRRLWRHRRADGSEFLAEVDWTRCRIDGLDCEIVLVTDVTAREEALESLARSEERFRSALDLLLDGFHLFSPIRDASGSIVDFRFDYVNDAASDIVGRSKSDLIGRTMLEVFPGARTQEYVERYRTAVDARRSIEFEATPSEDDEAQHRRGRLFSVLAAPVGDQLGVAFRDVTEDRIREADRSRRVFEARRQLTQLTVREREILQFADDDVATNREIGRALHISTRTVESHLASAYRKLHVTSRSAAVAAYRQLIDAADVREAQSAAS